MLSWLLEHQAKIQSFAWIGAMILVALWESFLPRRALVAGTGIRWLNNIGLKAAEGLLVWLLLPLALFSFAMLVEERGWGLLNAISAPLWLSCILTVLLLDLSAYAVHRIFHGVPLLWRCHKVHHCDIEVDCGTAIRHHPLESLLVIGADFLVVAVLGAPPFGVFVATMLAALAAVFNHGNVAMPSAVDRVLRRLLVTPDMHRVHHSTSFQESNSNFSNLFSCWDRFFATYRDQPELAPEAMQLGLEEARTAGELTFWKLLVMPFVPARQTARKDTPQPQSAS
jgi:sterol desaturase/sphingolipid hydroxylase (fatty acid hydroxylase superfamily)